MRLAPRAGARDEAAAHAAASSRPARSRPRRSAVASISASVVASWTPRRAMRSAASGGTELRPTIANSGTPAASARSPISPTILPMTLCSSIRPSPAMTPRAAAQALVEADGVEDVRRARLERGVETRPQAARQPARGAGHRDAARVLRKLGRVGVEALGESLHHRLVGALLRAVDLGAALPGRASRRRGRRSGRRRSRRGPRARRARRARRPTVAEPPTATMISATPACAAAWMSWPVP